MKWQHVVATTVLLTGCSTPESRTAQQRVWLQEAMATCRGLGLTDQNALAQCASPLVQAKITEDRDQRAAAIDAAAAGMNAMSRAYSDAAAARAQPMPQSTTCRTRPMGNGTYATTCD
ncbi:hypothetical protein [Phreatobacter stygius]|uniref:Lipoprotein n=1 Tax=Phreatobacter stygius TaxID=1940610 RepID=A0A4D7BDV1_9HYPH|nr:hypothetical protein [Phreatobacter stygius]QCI67516.1 hypothetical protein E8M01_26810 [Phreatobacter stygius]